MANVLIPNAELIAILTAIKTGLAAGKTRLVKAPVALTPNMDTSALIAAEADYTGYAAITTATPDGPFIDYTRGGVTLLSPDAHFVVGATPTVTNQIYGGWYEDSGGPPGLLIVAFVFNNPVTMMNAGDTLLLESIFNMSLTSPIVTTILVNGVAV